MSGNYKVIVTGTGNYVGNFEVPVSISIGNPLVGSISYATPIVVNSGSSGSQTITKSSAGGDNIGSATLSYSISPTLAGVTVDANGAVQVSTSTAAHSNQYTVTATASGAHTGSKTATINVVVKYGTFTVADVTDYVGNDPADIIPSHTPAKTSGHVYEVAIVNAGKEVSGNLTIDANNTKVIVPTLTKLGKTEL